MTAAHTSTRAQPAVKPNTLPPPRAFARQARVAGPTFARVGGRQARGERRRFSLPKEFRRSRHQPSAMDLHPWSFSDAHKRSSVVIQFAQLAANHVIVPPALPFHHPIGRVVTTHSLKRVGAISITSTGAPLPAAVRNPLARTFSVDLTPIRVHTDASAQRVVRSLSTRAFAYGNHIFLGPGEQPSDLRLMAHEVAHVVQQSQSATLQHFTPAVGNVFEQEAEAASAAAVRGAPFTVRERTTPRPQGLLGISLPNPLTWLMNRADRIPGFRMLTIILGRNPITGTEVPRSAANIFRAVIGFIPGGELIVQALDNYGIFDRVGAWVEQQINLLGMTAGLIRTAVTEFISSLSVSDILHLGRVWDRAVSIFAAPIDRLISFGRTLATGILGIIKDAILRPLARLAQGTRGWDLLTAVLGQNPITGERVQPNAETLIGGFMRLIQQEEVWANIQRARAVPRAWAWFQGALEGLISLVRDIPSRFVSELRQLELIDIVILPRAFMRIGRVFAGFLGSFFSWAGNQVLALLQIIFEVVAPRAMPYIRRTGGALSTIFRNPGGFARNLVRAGVQGFRQFKDNFLNHLRRSLIEWLTGAMSGAGIYIPQAFNFREIVKFVLSVLGLTWQNLRARLVRAIGPTAVSVLETTFDVVVTLVREGPAAAWERIRESISNLREMVMDQIMTFVRQRIVVAAITTLVSSLVPGAGFIRAIMSIYDTVMFFVERARQIAQVVGAYIDSLAAIASGNIGTAANRVETTMARTLTIVISFLASVLRFGRVSDHVMGIINRLRQPIDQALDRVVAWIRERAQSLLQRAAGGTPQQRLERGLTAGQSAVNRFAGRRVGALVLRPLLALIRTRYQLQILEAVARGGRWVVRGMVNPAAERATDAQVEGADGTNVQSRWTQGIQAITALIEQSLREPVDEEVFQESIQRIKQQFGFREIIVMSPQPGPENDTVVAEVFAVMNPQYRIRRARVKTTPIGTRNFPIPLSWFKRATTYVSFVAKSNGVNATFQPRGRRPIDVPTALQNQWGGVTQIILGVNPTYWRGVGDMVQRTPSGSRTIQGRLRNLLQHPLHGLPVSGTVSGLQVDHVCDLGFSGPDRLSNLWPISAVANQAASDVYRQNIRFRVQGQRGYRGPLINAGSPALGKYFRIRNIR